MSYVLGCPNEGIQRYYSHKEVPYEGYFRDRAICELKEGMADFVDDTRLSVFNHVLLSTINQMVIPRAGKSNIPTFLEIFYCWCVLSGLPLNLPFIILSYMEIVLANKMAKLPYGVMLTVIAKRRNVNLSVYATEKPSVQRSYRRILLQNMGFKLLGKVWTRVEDPDLDEDSRMRNIKHKFGSTTKQKAAPPRKSMRLAKRRTVMTMVEDDESESSQSPVKLIESVEVEDSLELSEGVGEVPQDQVLVEKDDYLEYSVEMPLADPSPLAIHSPPLNPADEPAPASKPVVPSATAEPESNRVATLFIGVSDSMNDCMHT